MKLSSFKHASIATALLFVIGCESRVQEKSVEGYDNKMNVEEAATAQAEFDTRVQEIEFRAQEILNLLSKVAKAIKSEEVKSLSTFDMLSEINQKVSNQLTRAKGDELFVKGKFKLENVGLTGMCEDFEYVVSAKSIKPLNQINYLLKSCNNPSQFLQVMAADFTSGSMILKFNSENLDSVIPQGMKINTGECKFSADQKTNVCRDIIFAETKDQRFLANITFQQETVITIRGISKKTGALIYDGEARISDDAPPMIKINGPYAELN